MKRTNVLNPKLVKQRGWCPERQALVELPVFVRIWIRPNLQREQFEIIREARPSVLFLVSDGGRNDDERERIAQSRAVFDDIDWDCDVYQLYWCMNVGMYTSASQSADFIWERADRCVWLEDDIMPSVSAFRFWAEMLDKYEDDKRVLGVCAMNHEGISEDVKSDYFFSREASIWGMGIWRRTYNIRSLGFEFANDPYLINRMEENASLNPDFNRRLRGYASGSLYEGHAATGEFWNAFSALVANQLYIVPKKNMISNRGCRADSAHADEIRLLPKGMRRVFDMERHELEFPLKEPLYIVPDIRYQKAVYRIMGVGHPLVIFHRRVQRALRILVFRGPSALLRKLKSHHNRLED